MSIDPVTFLDTGNPGMFNRYAYTENDPINMLDPDGRQGTPFGIMQAVQAQEKLRVSDPAEYARGRKGGTAIFASFFGGGAVAATRYVASRFLFQGIAAGEAGLGMAASEFSGTTNVTGAVRNVTAEGLTALNKQFSNGLTMVGKDASTVVANASYRSDAHDQAASVIRDVAGGHLFQNGNKRTAQAAVEGMEISGLSSSQIRSTIDNVATGDIRNIDEIADSLRGN